MNNVETQEYEYYLDITADRCPMTFVKTRLMLDKMQAGQKLLVRLAGQEPLMNVPRSAKEIGCIVSEPVAEEDMVYRVVIQKA